MNYEEFLDGLSLRHFHPGEITSQGERVRSGVQNTLPPEHLWAGIVETLWIADMVRHQSGIALIITSAYRSPQYNAKCPGASSRSQHMANTALDLIPIDGGVGKLFDAFKQIRKAGGFKGGLGRYPDFIHLDTRGRNTTW
jgi:uncharacterized protein YcbK (DUF882 family)